jgi:hypothetical protein
MADPGEIRDGDDGEPSAWPDATVVARLRAGDERAARELYARLAPPLLREARRLHVQPGLQAEAVSDVLRAVCTTLARAERAVPASLLAYAARALHRHARLLEQHARAAHAPLHDALQVAEPDALFDSSNAGTDEELAGRTPHHALGQLVAALALLLTAEERQLLVWLADHVPQREIARWRGTSFGAMRGRIVRLREKARALAWRWIATRPPDERAQLARRLEIAGQPLVTPTLRASPRAGARPATRHDTPSTRATMRDPSTGASDDAAPQAADAD